MTHTRLVLLAFLALAACGEPCGDPTTKAVPGAWPSEAERTLAADRAPTPYTAEQLRAACPNGRRSTYRIERPGVTPFLQIMRFRLGDDEGVEIETVKMGSDGTSLGPPQAQRATWTELQSHASFPVEITTVTEEDVQVPAGTFACFLYDVSSKKGDREATSRFWFARDLPGPPVQMENYLDGELVHLMNLVETTIETPPESE